MFRLFFFDMVLFCDGDDILVMFCYARQVEKDEPMNQKVEAESTRRNVNSYKTKMEDQSACEVCRFVLWYCAESILGGIILYSYARG